MRLPSKMQIFCWNSKVKLHVPLAVPNSMKFGIGRNCSGNCTVIPRMVVESESQNHYTIV